MFLYLFIGLLVGSALFVESIIGWKNQAEAGLQRSAAL